MKRYSVSLAMLCFPMLLFSCKKEAEPDNKNTGFSQDIKNFVSQSIIDSMRSYGMIINEGKTPPVINGIYDLTRNVCVFDNSGSNRTGEYFADCRYRFHDQNNEKLTVSLDYKALNAPDTAAGIGSFLAGNNNSFTAFVNMSGVAHGIAYKQIGFYSGRITETGIEGFQMGFYFTEKGPDPDNKLVKVGSSRIFNDEDEFSDMNTVFRGIRSKSTLVGSK